jgi:hypothetical protein
MHSEDQRKMVTTLNLGLLCLETILLAVGCRYVLRDKLGANIRFGLLLSVCIAVGWALVSLCSFLYISPRVLANLSVFGGWLWLEYTGALFLLVFLSERFLFFLPWRLALLIAGLIAVVWLLGLSFGRALGAFEIEC